MLELELKKKKSNKNKMFKMDCQKDFAKLQIVKNCIYGKKCGKHTSNTFPRKLVLISNNKINGKSRCFICLTEITFIDEIQCDLESAL